jgi:hypothetical protein
MLLFLAAAEVALLAVLQLLLTDLALAAAAAVLVAVLHLVK